MYYDFGEICKDSYYIEIPNLYYSSLVILTNNNIKLWINSSRYINIALYLYVF